jgi:type IX secretion system PorP/SprF family membrane protein
MKKVLFLWKTLLIATLCSMVLAVKSVAQQNIQFTQYMFNGLVINPAYAGADEALSLTFIQRSQWTGIENAPNTQTLTAHTLFKKKQVGLGLILVNDEIGIHKNLNVLSSYAYHLRVGKESYLSMGLQAGIKSIRSDYASLINSSGNDPAIYDALTSRTFFDFGAGLYFRSPRFHAGISAPQLIPQQFSVNDTLSVSLSKANLLAFSKYRFSLDDKIDLEPSMMIKYMNGVPLSFDINLNMIYRKVLTLGLSYRKNESIDFLMKAQATPQLQVGYSYDHPFGTVARVSNGSHELMVQYVFRYVEKNVTSPR